MITVLDYDAGNIKSVEKALHCRNPATTALNSGCDYHSGRCQLGQTFFIKRMFLILFFH